MPDAPNEQGSHGMPVDHSAAANASPAASPTSPAAPGYTTTANAKAASQTYASRYSYATPPPPEPNAKWPRWRVLATGVGFGTAYLLLFRLLSLTPPFVGDQKGGAILMSFAFLFLGPFVTGLICCYQKPSNPRYSTMAWIFAPWLAVTINVLIAFAMHWEGLICVIFIAPPAFLMASLGGVAAGLYHLRAQRKLSATTLSCIAALPFLLAVVEAKVNQPLILRSVPTEITIHAPASVIWRNIERVRAIQPAELRHSWAVSMGFPRPVEATLSYEGIGGVRNASFERGLSFLETVTAWEPGRRIAFSIKADTSAIPSTTLDEHVQVGGRFFDVLDGEYTIEPLPNGDSILHLTSHQRLSTDFNQYAALWSDGVMKDLQTNILQVIQHRCEADTAALNTQPR